MDYLEIILRGYFNEYDCEALDKYFFREYKKAEKEQFYEAEQFFTGCMNALKKLEQGISEKLYRRKNELYLMLNAAENGFLTYTDLEGKTVEQKRRETIEYCTKELEYIEKEGKNITPIEFGYKGMFYRINKQGLDVIATAISKAFQETQPKNEALQPQPIAKQKPEPNRKSIIFKNNETIKKIHSELKGYFTNKEKELLKVLQGEQLSEMLLFPHNQNKFVEVFRRLKYNGFLLNNDTEIRDWICKTFMFIKKGYSEPQPFKENTVWDILNKGKGEPGKKERICISEWLPYKSPSQLEKETENEKI
ncbi:hypothetical protein [Tenuifilum osseticum]|uniref:hypothetical protein n=1 Tax=Tenuifilum osseticum TaxID=3374723 RepID=UPI0034E4B1E3